MTVEKALKENGISITVYEYPLLRKETEVIIDTTEHDAKIRADERAKVLKDLYASDKSSTLKELLNTARAEGAREFAKWLEDTYWIELSISNDVCHNYDCDEIIKEYEKEIKEKQNE